MYQDFDLLKRKNNDYAIKLGKSHEMLRIEREKARNVQNENKMLQKTLKIMEATMI